MSYFIVIRGPAGVGKSIISKELSKKIKSRVYPYDRVMRGFGFNYIPGDKWIPLNKFLKADKLMIPKFKQKLKEGTNLILDGNFYHKEQIDNVISNMKSQALLIEKHLETVYNLTPEKALNEIEKIKGVLLNFIYYLIRNI